MERMRRNLAQRLAKPELNAIRGAEETLLEMYRLGPAMFTPDMAIKQLKETGDAQLFDFLYDTLMNWDVLNLTSRMSNESRTRAVQESRRMFARDVVSKHIIQLWTDFGFGLNVEIMTKDDEPVQAFWDEFWEAPRNSHLLGQRSIHELSERILVDGEIFFVFFISTIDGTATIRAIRTEEITAFITSDEDMGAVVFYKREYTPNGTSTPVTVYYTDWRIEKGSEDYIRAKEKILTKDARAVFMDDKGDERNTEVKVLFAGHNVMNIRGWPLLTASAPWARTYKQFLEDRASVARAVAMYVDKLDVKGGQRAIDYVISNLQSGLVSGQNYYDNNPRPTAGSTWVENEAIERTRQSLSTGAGDAQKDGSMLIGQALLGGGLFPHYAGMGDAYRLATATAMELPVLKRMQRYQNFWSSIWTDIAMIVLQAGIDYGNLPDAADLNVDVSLDSILIKDVEQLGKVKELIEGWVMQGGNFEGAKEAMQKILELVLQQIGIKSPNELLNPEIVMPDDDEDVPEPVSVNG